MLKNISAILLACLLSAGSVQAADDLGDLAGHDKTTWGMTPDEVLNAEFPRAEKLEKPLEYIVGFGLVRIKEIQVGDTKFSALFIFDKRDQKLRQVLFTSAEKNIRDNTLSFSSVEKILTEKYGPPTHTDEKVRGVSWKLPHTFVDLYLKMNSDTISQVTINYLGRNPRRGNAERAQ